MYFFLQYKNAIAAPMLSAKQSIKSKFLPTAQYFWINSDANPHTETAMAIRIK
jgi:hypothetical protein